MIQFLFNLLSTLEQQPFQHEVEKMDWNILLLVFNSMRFFNVKMSD